MITAHTAESLSHGKVGKVGMKTDYGNGFCDGLLIGMSIAFLIMAVVINI